MGSYSNRGITAWLFEHLRIAYALYFAGGVALTPLCAQWFDPKLNALPLFAISAGLFLGISLISLASQQFIRDFGSRLVVIAVVGTSAFGSLFPLFDFSPFIFTIFGIGVLYATMDFFGSLRDLDPELADSTIKDLLTWMLTLFTIFISAMLGSPRHR